MNEFLNTEIFMILGLIIISVAFVTIILSITAAVLYRRKNELISKTFSEIEKKETFELITPVILKRIENVTKIVEEKQKIIPVPDENNRVNVGTETKNEIISSETKSENKKLERENNQAEKESELRDVSERFKIDNRFLKDPNRS